ncbi:MAG: riboflavin synthase [Gemmatimonadales bacterium]
MFTGIVEAVGRVAAVTVNDGAVLRITAPLRRLRKGESIAVNGACLTVERVVKGGFTVHAVGTTLERTAIGEWTRGRRINLERALRVTDRLGGHFVQGHVDGIGIVEKTASSEKPSNEGVWLLDIAVPADVAETTILRGAIAIDGVSLTVNAIPRPGVVRVSLVPYTLAHTTLGTLQAGDRVHVEADVLAKYVRQLCRSRT